MFKVDLGWIETPKPKPNKGKNVVNYSINVNLI